VVASADISISALRVPSSAFQHTLPCLSSSLVGQALAENQTICFYLVSTTGSLSAAMCSLLTICKIAAIK